MTTTAFTRPSAATSSPARRMPARGGHHLCGTRDGQPTLTDGPFAETAEMIGGSTSSTPPTSTPSSSGAASCRRATPGDPPVHLDGHVGLSDRRSSRDRRPRPDLARRVGPSAGPARRPVPAARPRRGRPRRRLRGRDTDLAGGTAYRPTGRLVADYRAATRPGPVCAEAMAARKEPCSSSTRAPRRRPSEPWPTLATVPPRSRMSGSGWSSSARTRPWRPGGRCAHPAARPRRLDSGPGRLFLVAEPTMAARLTRARKKLAVAGVPFALPSAERLAERVDVVATVAYLAFTAGYAPGSGPDVVRTELAGRQSGSPVCFGSYSTGMPHGRRLLGRCSTRCSRSCCCNTPAATPGRRGRLAGAVARSRPGTVAPR